MPSSTTTTTATNAPIFPLPKNIEAMHRYQTTVSIESSFEDRAYDPSVTGVGGMTDADSDVLIGDDFFRGIASSIICFFLKIIKIVTLLSILSMSFYQLLIVNVRF